MFRLKVNQLDNSLKEQLKQDFKITKHHNSVIFNTTYESLKEFTSFNENNDGSFVADNDSYKNLEFKIRIDQDQFLKEGFIEWDYCIHPGKDLWLSRKSSLNNIGMFCQEILEKKMFHNSYLEEIKETEE
jgi:hypothetical protein